MEPEGIRHLAERADRALDGADMDVYEVESVVDDVATVASSLEGEATRLHREIERALDTQPDAVTRLTRELRECYRDLEVLRPRLRALTLRQDELKTAQDE